MSNLARFKKHGETGFKAFVLSLETIGPSKREAIMKLAIKEDEDYVLHAEINLLDIGKVALLNGEETNVILENFPNGPYLLARALYQLEEEEIVREKLKNPWDKQYAEERELIMKCSMREQQNAQFSLFKVVREMQKRGFIHTLSWKLPNPNILSMTAKERQARGL